MVRRGRDCTSMRSDRLPPKSSRAHIHPPTHSDCSDLLKHTCRAAMALAMALATINPSNPRRLVPDFDQDYLDLTTRPFT